MKRQMASGKEGVRQSVQIFVADTGQIDQLDAAIGGLLVLFAAVDGYLMATPHKARGNLFGEGFEASIVRRNSPGAEESDVQTGRSRYRRAAFERAATPADFLGAGLATGSKLNQLAM